MGYEIHQGETRLLEGTQPLLEIVQRAGHAVCVLDGAISPDSRAWGTYLHGLFDNDDFRLAFVNHLREAKGLRPVDVSSSFQFGYEKQRQYDRLAELVREHLDIRSVYEIMELEKG